MTRTTMQTMTVRQKLAVSRKVLVFVDPDYCPETGNPKTVHISRKQAYELIGSAGKDHPIRGVLNSDGCLLLYPGSDT